MRRRLLYDNANNQEYVDLGLPSGLLWATCNLGAETETDYGLYFQWGDTKGYKNACAENESDGNSDAHYFNGSKYKYCNGTSTMLTKYCTQSGNGTVDNKTVLEAEDDAATVMLGDKWRIPTRNELEELRENTVPVTRGGYDNYGGTSNHNGTGVSGVLLKSKINDNTIFFPATGYYHYDSIANRGSEFAIWSSGLWSGYDTLTVPLTARIGSFIQSSTGWLRCDGLPIRAVLPK